jgi:hypothetical protein
VFLNSNRDGWIKASRKHCVVLKPIKEKVDESDDLKLVQGELQVKNMTDFQFLSPSLNHLM